MQRTLRPGLHRRRDLALEVVRSYTDPSVLDVGCGSGRIGEGALEAGASRYVGVDFSVLGVGEERRRDGEGQRITRAPSVRPRLKVHRA